MKKQIQKIKGKKGFSIGSADSTNENDSVDGGAKMLRESQPLAERTSRAIQKTPKKQTSAEPGAAGKFVSKSGQFLREAKVELKKVKWPTRKELLASTAVVIVLTLLLAFFLGLVDLGLIKIIRGIAG